MKSIELMKKRRSARSFLDKNIPMETLLELLEGARVSPSGGNGQNWCFGIVKDKKRIEDLAQAAGNQDWIITAPVVIVCCAKLDGDLKDVPEDDFGLIVNYTRFGKEFVEYLNQYEDRFTMNTFWNNANPLIPGEHILLAAAECGISGCFVGYLDLKQVNQLLNLPPDMTSLYLIPLGYRSDEPKDIDRKSLEEIVFFEKWD